MNPATDVGKRNLPPGIRNRFTELYVEELRNEGDLQILIMDYLRGLNVSKNTVQGIVNFYLAVRKEAETKLVDGTGHRPHYSLRTLCRALRFAASNPCSSIQRSLYEVITCIEVYFSLCIHCRVCLGKGKSTLLGAVLKTNDSLILMCSVCFFS